VLEGGSGGAMNFVEPRQNILPNVFRIYIKQFLNISKIVTGAVVYFVESNIENGSSSPYKTFFFE
jgi:hypothetical protein